MNFDQSQKDTKEPTPELRQSQEEIREAALIKEQLQSESKKSDHTDEHFKGQQASEIVICFFRQHGIVLIPYLLILLLILILIVYTFFIVLFNKPSIFEIEVSEALALFVILLGTYYINRCFNKFLNYYLQIVILTNYRLIDLHKTLFLRDDKNIIDLHEIQEIEKTQKGILKTIFNFGEIRIVLSGTTQEKCLTFVPIPDRYFRRIHQAKRDYILQRQGR